MPRKKSPPLPPSQYELDYSEFGETLRRLIKAKGYTQEGFAEAVGISYSSMMSILKGERRIYLHTYRKMLDVLGLTDVLIMSDMYQYPDLFERASLYTVLVSKLDKMPTSVLASLIGLVLEIEKRD